MQSRLLDRVDASILTPTPLPVEQPDAGDFQGDAVEEADHDPLANRGKSRRPVDVNVGVESALAFEV